MCGLTWAVTYNTTDVLEEHLLSYLWQGKSLFTKEKQTIDLLMQRWG